MAAHDAARPYLAEVRIDPADLDRMVRRLEEWDIARVVEVDRSTPDLWRVLVACPSEGVVDRIEDGWG